MIEKSRNILKKIIFGKKNKFLIIIGPCSIHSYLSCKRYSNFIIKKKNKFNNIFIIMRLYIEKPRTIIGWKGYVYDPDINNSYKIKKGIFYSKKFLKKIKIPVAMEFLNPIISDLFSKYITLGTVGARTTESQIHKEISSKYNFPIGFKNNTNGNIDCAINSIIATKFQTISLNLCKKKMKIYFVKTKGNKKNFIILRGGKNPNFNINNIINLIKKKNNIKSGIVIDINHDNSKKKYKLQFFISKYLVKKIIPFFNELSGIMIESHIKSGFQKGTKYNKSITDPCINIKKSFLIIKNINKIINLRKIYY
ncbi:3-deoxy-7-phosphoheptulonate synthase [Candidatus Vidania fulgoroideorum]